MTVAGQEMATRSGHQKGARCDVRRPAVTPLVQQDDVPAGLDVAPPQWALVLGILQRHVPQYTVWAFGSRTQGTARRHSDLDLAVIAADPLPWRVYGALKEAFSESDLPWKVDVLDWATTAAPFRQLVQAHHVVVQAGLADARSAG